MDTRQEIRTHYRRQRNQLTASEQSLAAEKILPICLHSSLLSQAKTVACYLANDAEIDSRLIIDYCWQHNKRVVLPVLHPFSKGHLLFVEYKIDTPMYTNRYGIEEPIPTSQNLCLLNQIDVIFTPLVAFDATGNRLGMGGGYYDRSLAPISRDNLKTQLIGLAHECQQTDKLVTDSWDIPLNGIATPKQFFSVS